MFLTSSLLEEFLCIFWDGGFFNVYLQCSWEVVLYFVIVRDFFSASCFEEVIII